MGDMDRATLEWPIVALYTMVDGAARYWTACEMGIKGNTDEVQAEFDRRVQAALDAVSAWVALLQVIEWAGRGLGTEAVCPVCMRTRTQGHAEGCALQRALRGSGNG